MSSGGHADDETPKRHVNRDRWVISYADFMTLLFALFVVLFASSVRNQAKMEEEVKGMMAAFHGVSPTTAKLLGATQGVLNHQPSPIPRPTEHPAPRVPREPTRAHQTAPVKTPLPPHPHGTLVSRQPAEPSRAIPTPIPHPSLSEAVSQQLAEESLALEHVKNRLETLLSPLTAGHQVSINASPLTLTISLDAAVLFDSGKADLLQTAKTLLGDVAGSLKSLPAPFTIELQGYTDNQPIKTAQFPSNWSLSAERAVSVVELFANEGLDGSRLTAQGFGEFVPIADNTTQEGRTKNRRVVIVIRAPDVQSPPGP
jgi:chemotaxis protein MotB